MLQDLLTRAKLINHNNPVILDVGANIGQSIDFFLKHYPKAEIYSFEPTQSLVIHLKNKYHSYTNVHINNIALSDTVGDAVLFVSEYSPTNSLYKPDVQVYKKFGSPLSVPFSKIKTERCKTDTLNNWYNNFIKNKEIDLLKIDVQGAEYKVLNGGINTIIKKVKAISIELQYVKFYENSKMFYEPVKLLYENGFFLFSFFENNRKRDNYQLLENNALFLNRKFFDISL